MRIGIYGGTFNPVHSGHLLLAKAYLDALRLDRLLVIPTRLPPHKQSDDLLPGAQRLEMCRLAFAELPACEVSDLELRRGDRSYTVDTLEQLRTTHPDASFFLLVGSDMFFTFTEWRQWERIAALAVLCVGAREDTPRPALEECAAALAARGVRSHILPLDPVPISSTEVRALAAAGKPLDGVVPPAVARYIEENQLYRLNRQTKRI